MAHESFEDEEVANLMNEYYVCIKVDREERPDIDEVYMNVCQRMTGQGGWPLTIVMTPDQKPFYAATYLPKHSNWGMLGMMELLPKISSLWRERKQQIQMQTDHILSLLKQEEDQISQEKEPQKELLHQAVWQLNSRFQRTKGGFGRAPLFPTPHNLLFLMDYYRYEKQQIALDMVEVTLTQMYRGGIFDHIGGGFSRYSTDSIWLVPHFEKMLYDNALLIQAYLRAYEITGRTFYKTVAQKTLDYVLRELTDSEGGFYCGQDADSEGVEGKYYVFTPAEIRQILPQEDAKLFCKRFGISKNGNFEGKNIPNLLNEQEYESFDPNMEAILHRVKTYRQNRTTLHKDDKILTSWNGLMIVACAHAYRVLGEERYLKAGITSQNLIYSKLTTKEGKLLIRYRKGQADFDGQISDYANYIWALLALYQTSFHTEYLKLAIQMANQMVVSFFDEERGGFFSYSKEGEQLITRPKESYDGAMPSGNSVAAYVLGILFQLTGEIRWKSYIQKQLSFLVGNAEDMPSVHCFGLRAVAKVVYPSSELVCVGRSPLSLPELQQLWKLAERYQIALLLKTPENEKKLSELAPFTKEYPIPYSKTAYYLCYKGTCRPPFFTIEDLTLNLKDT